MLFRSCFCSLFGIFLVRQGVFVFSVKFLRGVRFSFSIYERVDTDLMLQFELSNGEEWDV